MNDTTNPVLARFQNEPALLCSSQRAWFEVCAVEASKVSEVGTTKELLADDFWGHDDPWLARMRPYSVVDGILQVPVKGLLLNNFPFAAGTWATGYEYIWEAMKRGLDDSEVKGIALVIDSGGGMVAGNSDLVDKIFERRGEKPIKAFASESAYSAAYAIASVADDITVSRSGGVGSIGVVVIHMEYARNLDTNGITVNIIRSKDGKMEGNPYEELSVAAQARIQNKVDTFHKEFVALVARNRGMSEEAVDSTDALTFMAQEAIENGLADSVGSLDDSITAFAASINSDEGDDLMATEPKADTILTVDHKTAVDEAKASGVTEGHASGVTDERARVSAIMDSDEGKARPKAALSAIKTSMSADEAIGFLAGISEEKAEEVTPATPEAKGAGAPDGMLEAAMNGTPNPELGAGAETKTTAETEEAELMGNIQSFGLLGFKTKTK